MTALKNLVTHRSLQNRLENLGFVVDMVNLLDTKESSEVRLAVVMILSSICKLSPARQEQAVLAGVIPLLLDCIEEHGKLQQLSISLLCSFVSASVACRAYLHKFDVFSSFISLLEKNLVVFDAISSWAVYEPNKCKKYFLQEKNFNICVEVFNKNDDESVQCMVRIIRSSDEVAVVAGKNKKFLQGVYSKLAKCLDNALKAKNCLELLLAVASRHPKPKQMLEENNFYSVISKILRSSRDENLVVIEEIASLFL